MKKNSRTVVSALTIAILLVAGCRAKELSPPPPASLVSISVSPISPSIAPGTTLQLTAQGTFSNGVKQNLTSSVTWESSDASIATVSDTTGSKGLATAVSAGTTTITATFGSLSGLVTLTTSSVASISIAPLNPTSIAPGTTQQFTAIGTLEDATTQVLTIWAAWTSSNTGVATFNNASGPKGLATAVGAGSSTITASYGGISGSAAFTSSAVASIAVSPTTAGIANGSTQQFTATGSLEDAATQALTTWATWTSSNTGVATISNAPGSQGLATAVSEGTTTISSSFSGVLSSMATLTVTPAVLTSVTVTPADPSIALGKTQQFTATGTFSDGKTQNITSSASWSSSNVLVSTISNTAGSNGLAASVGVGSTTITATSGIISGTTTLTITPAVLESIEVTPASATISISTNIITQQFAAMGIFTDGSSQDLTTSVTWNSSNISIANISNAPGSQGLATVSGVGTTNITATFSGITSNTATLTVTFF